MRVDVVVGIIDVRDGGICDASLPGFAELMDILSGELEAGDIGNDDWADMVAIDLGAGIHKNRWGKLVARIGGRKAEPDGHPVIGIEYSDLYVLEGRVVHPG